MTKRAGVRTPGLESPVRASVRGLEAARLKWCHRKSRVTAGIVAKHRSLFIGGATSGQFRLAPVAGTTLPLQLDVMGIDDGLNQPRKAIF